MRIRFTFPLISLVLLIIPHMAFATGKTPGFNPLRNAYFGDLHVHTGFSWDARLVRTKTLPEDAYRYAKGEPIDLAGGGTVQLKHGNMDFFAVTDHAEYLGVVDWIQNQNPEGSGDDSNRIRFLKKFMKHIFDGKGGKKLDFAWYKPEVERTAWQEIISAAERHYEPGKFTTFIAYEWTADRGTYSVHRNVIFRGSKVPVMPYSSINSDRPEDLWNWMDGIRAQGMEALAIPHNANLSGGFMFPGVKPDGSPLDAKWAAQRMRNEPLVEVTQIKGTSETHPLLSPTDEWADFEIVDFKSKEAKIDGSYVRQAYKTGLALSENKGFNPYQFGMIGSTDTHNSASCQEEDNYFGKLGILTATPVARLQQSYKMQYDLGQFSAAGLAGVWADENTREAIYDALRRKECFATTGPRIRVRFFAGYDFPEALNQDCNMVKKAYDTGVPMGGDLLAHVNGKAPRFLFWATQDPQSAPLQRIQVVKGWMQDGKVKEKVFDVAGSDGLTPDPKTHRLADNGARVDLKTGIWDVHKGEAELSGVWTDPEFDPGQWAFYYVRVLENPTLRWSTYDANRLGIAPRPDLPATIQERAYTSPIWYSPKK
ncbi:MAG: DUF3604 domain-containing protein [Deltaproteobacteria bacterium]|nr:DUF3604 domain-containing protein [Deltaproteobacteria bacterium]